MVSAQIIGTLRFYKIDANNNQTLITVANIQDIGNGGSSEGVIANTREKWGNMPVFGEAKKALNVNDRLRVTFEAKSAQTCDASDSAFILPITLSDGTLSYLRDWTLTSEWNVQNFADQAFVANQETPICEKLVSVPFYLGNNSVKAFVSVEDNA